MRVQPKYLGMITAAIVAIAPGTASARTLQCPEGTAEPFANFGTLVVLDSGPHLVLADGSRLLLADRGRTTAIPEGSELFAIGVRCDGAMGGTLVIEQDGITVLAAPGGKGGGKGSDSGSSTSSDCDDHVDNDGDGFCDYSYGRAYCLDGSRVGDSDCSGRRGSEACSSPSAEVCDGRDNDCDGALDEGGVCSTDYFCDADGDGHASSSVTGSCSTSGCVPAGCSTSPGHDCDDSNPAVSPGAFENCDVNGIDDDCDGAVDECDSCSNGTQDPGETDVDCGGDCPDCDLGDSCATDLDCLSGNCSGGVCVETPGTLDPQCVPLKHDGGPLDGRLNIVMVPSGFNGDMNLFRQKAEWIQGIFDQYVPFRNDVEGLNVFYVPIEQGDYCDFGCNGIDRLLCCTISTAKAISSTCTSGRRQTVVVHNSDTYGGAGNISADVATTSIHPSAPKVAVHELGHSAFNLADEYDYYGATPMYPNCDLAGCAKWSDMLGYAGVGCLSNHCAGGAYFAAENTIMKSLSYHFEEVNLRVSCCAYLQETGGTPPYCDQFTQFAASADLHDFCQIEPSSAGGGAPTTFVRQPQRINLTKAGDAWVVESIEPMRPGRYPVEQVRGQATGRLRVDLAFADGTSRRMRFDEETRVEFPRSEGFLGGYESVERESLTLIVERRGRPALTAIGVHRD